MRILLIGNFAPPYDDESLHNLSLLKMFGEEGNNCRAINIAENPSKENGITNAKGFVDFILKLIRHAWKRDVIHFLTKGYTRPGLIKLIASTLYGRLLRAQTVITLLSELFSITGHMRSRHLGEPVLRLCFSMANKVICSDKNTYETAVTLKTKNNFEIIPSFIHIDENLKNSAPLAFKKIENKKKVVFCSNVIYPSFLFEILNKLLSSHLSTDIGVIVSLSEKFSAKLQHVIEETGKRLKENIVFVDSDNIKMVSIAHSKSDLYLRPLSCDGEMFFSGFTVSIKKPESAENYLYFSKSMLLIEEGETADSCALIINDILLSKADTLSQPPSGDFYLKIKEIYSKQD